MFNKAYKVCLKTINQFSCSTHLQFDILSSNQGSFLPVVAFSMFIHSK